MRYRQLLISVGLLGVLAAGAGEAAEPGTDKEDNRQQAFALNRRLGRGINLGNALEAPKEGAWGVRLEAEYFRRIREAGFQSVRLPIRWSAHAAAQPPYTIDPAFFQRVDWAVEQARKQGLAIVLNVHHYEELFQQPAAHEARLLALWEQIAEHYRAQPAEVYFELLNEPHGALSDARWNQLIPQLLAVVRRHNPQRAVIVGPGHWNNIAHLEQLKLPADPFLLVTIHYYLPFEFTHQGASWVPLSKRWLGTTWGQPAQRAALERDLERAAAWGRQHRRPLYVGEFGAYQAADLASRVAWTAAVARAAERRGMSWAYWEFCAGFGVYDRQTQAWRRPLLEALIPSARSSAGSNPP
jgi:endoglucanase